VIGRLEELGIEDEVISEKDRENEVWSTPID
jgi:hypothetical protein